MKKVKKLEGDLTNTLFSPKVPSFPLKVASSNFRRDREGEPYGLRR